jgi:F420-dependent oxidoreductase-like protein
MAALTLDHLSGGRLRLGLGVSGPQVAEGWHGVPFDHPVRRTREVIEIIRLVEARERLVYHGRFHRLPLGDTRPIRSAVPPRRIPIHLAALGPANLKLTGELADGWIGNCFMPETAAVYLEPLRRAAEAAGRTIADIELQVPVTLEFDDDLEAVARRHAEGYAFTFGAMGTPGQNFYVAAFARQGFADEVHEVERLWLAGRLDEARDRVPVDLAVRSNLLGTEDTVKDRLRAYRDAGIDALRVGLRGDNIDERLEQLARLMPLVAAVDAETSAS